MSNITAFVDNVGRVIVGDVITTTDEHVKVKEPAVVNVQVDQQNGQISVQLLPFIFREFVKPECRQDGVVWSFDKANVVCSDNLELDDAIIKQYTNIFEKPVGAASQSAQVAKPVEPEVVKLFDDED